MERCENKMLKFGLEEKNLKSCLKKRWFVWNFVPNLPIFCKWLGSILLVDQDICLEYYLKPIILKDSNKTQRGEDFKTCFSHFYLWCCWALSTSRLTRSRIQTCSLPPWGHVYMQQYTMDTMKRIHFVQIFWWLKNSQTIHWWYVCHLDVDSSYTWTVSSRSAIWTTHMGGIQAKWFHWPFCSDHPYPQKLSNPN